jgi:hypothetical protein
MEIATSARSRLLHAIPQSTASLDRSIRYPVD